MGFNFLAPAVNQAGRQVIGLKDFGKPMQRIGAAMKRVCREAANVSACSRAVSGIVTDPDTAIRCDPLRLGRHFSR